MSSGPSAEEKGSFANSESSDGIKDSAASTTIFRDPPARFRALPFWAWNARLDPEEIASQIRSFREAGMGGFFMHSRDGLETPWLGTDWMKAVRIAVATAREEGLEAWLYDEDRWPSGSAGGRVPARGDDFRAKALTLELLETDYTPGPGTVGTAETGTAGEPGIPLALFRARLEGYRCCSATRLDPKKAYTCDAGASFLVFRIEVAAGDEWFNGESPTDTMNPDAVDAFIDLACRPYLDVIGEEAGRTVPGIFTDEPSVHDRHCHYPAGRGWLPWTGGFADFFRSRRGYDPLDRIHLVFFDGEGQSRIRHDYWRTVSERFAESYTKRIFEFCGLHGLVSTGHFLWENQLGTATRTGGAIMPHYRFQHMPGMDLLCEQIEETITAKQCSSVAHQFGRECISETYGCTGWEFSFEGQKWIGEWQAVLGITRRSQHLALYSLKGCRKRDYPPVFNRNTSWWRHARLMEDYFARLMATLSEGEVLRELLVLHPSSTAWSRLATEPRGFTSRDRDRNLPEVNRFGDDFNRFLRALLGAHHDFDLGDETIMAESAHVEAAGSASGQSDSHRSPGATLVIGKAAYRIILLPEMDTMFRSTLKLVLEFLDSGGTVIALAPGAHMLEGLPDPALGQLYDHPRLILARDEAEALRTVSRVLPQPVSFKNACFEEETSVLCMLRSVDGVTEKGCQGEHSGTGKPDRSSEPASPEEPGCPEEPGYPAEPARTEKILFALHTDRNTTKEILVTLPGRYEVTESDLFTGLAGAVRAESVGDTTRFTATFGPAGSRLYRLKPREGHSSPAPQEARAEGRGSPLAGRAFSPTLNFLVNDPILKGFGPVAEFSRTAPNALVLDTCSFSLKGNPWSPSMEVWKAQKEIREQLGMPLIHYNGLKQRYLWTGLPHPGDGAQVSFRFDFTVRDLPREELYLVLEDAGNFSISLNGSPVESSACGWFLDPSFEKIPLPAPCTGHNELILSCNYKNSMEIEDCFLLGEFAVDGNRALCTEPRSLRFGDWCLQGYPHYCGNMIYHFRFDAPSPPGELSASPHLAKTASPTIANQAHAVPPTTPSYATAQATPGPVRLHLGDFSGTLVEIRLNGRIAGHVPWKSAPSVDLSPLIRPKDNALEIEVAGSPRNLLGPFHLARGKVFFTEWSAFRPQDDEYTEGHVLHPYGLFGQVTTRAY